MTDMTPDEIKWLELSALADPTPEEKSWMALHISSSRGGWMSDEEIEARLTPAQREAREESEGLKYLLSALISFHGVEAVRTAALVATVTEEVRKHGWVDVDLALRAAVKHNAARSAE